MSTTTTQPDASSVGQNTGSVDRHGPEQDAAFGTSLIRWRRLRGLKQSHVAELCGTSQASYSRLERGLRRALPRECGLLRSPMAPPPDGAPPTALLRPVRNSNAAP